MSNAIKSFAKALIPIKYHGFVYRGFARIFDKDFRERIRFREDIFVPFILDQRRQCYLTVLHHLWLNRSDEIRNGYYFEFGIHGVISMRTVWYFTKYLFNWRYVAFDSFQGYPEIDPIDQQEIWFKGKNTTDKKTFFNTVSKAGMPNDRLIIVEGYYDSSLGEDVRRSLEDTKAAFILVDCDLYKSTAPVLEFSRHFLQVGTVIVFGQWNCFNGDPGRGQRRAWLEFRKQYPDLHFSDLCFIDNAKGFVFTGNGAANRS